MPMKVTVCFNQLKVLVPCGEGDILVRELIDKAVTRYKKASGKPNDYWVSVRTVRTLNDGGILDPDDQLNHVVDDREQLLADFEEQGGPSYPSNGDGASGSSAGTSSPDIFQSELLSNKNFHHRGYSMDGGNDVVVTDSDLSAGSSLTVRRGSEPALNTLEDEKPANGHIFNGLSIKKEEDVSKAEEDKKPKEKMAFNVFARDACRQSLGNTPSMFKWLEAQERQQEQYQKEKYQQMERKEPLGGSSVEPENLPKLRTGRLLPKTPIPPTQSEQNDSNETEMVVTLKNDGSPLGIHVVPDFDNQGRETGLLIQSIEPGGRISRDGRIKAESRIVQINGTDLFQISFHKAQEIFRAAMKTPEVVLKVLKAHVPSLSKRPPPTLPKPLGRHAPIKPSPLTLPTNKIDNDSWPSSPEKTSTPANYTGSTSSENSVDVSHDGAPLSPIELSSDKNQGSLRTDFRETSPTKKMPPAIPVRHPSTTLSMQKMDTENKGDSESVVKERAIIAPTNTKKIGKQIEIQLTKGPLGLGFSVTTRDNKVGEDSPIYIKNILPKGAAVTDGRLKAGDRLLEVNGIAMTGKTQAEAVSILRNTKMGETVNIVVSRQETEDDRFKVPRELKNIPPSTLDIPKKHSSENSQSSSSEDLHQQPPPWLQGSDWSRDPVPSTEEDLSPTGTFQREGFGRQSMSEKRKAHNDPRASEFYQRAKGTKEGGQKAHVHAPPPPTNLKRFSSLENLATTHDLDLSQSVEDDESSPPSPHMTRMTRGRGCNESFRAAVDRSYDPVPPMESSMETDTHGNITQKGRNVEEESSENGSAFSREQNSARSSLSSENTEDAYGKKKGKKGKDKKSTSGILKGIFRFGKGRKTPDEHLTKGEVPVTRVEEEETLRREQQHRDEESRAQSAEAQRMNRLDQYRGSFDQPLYPNQRVLYQQHSVPIPTSYNPGYDSHSSYPQDRPALPLAEQPVIVRGDKIQQLRSEHQRRHQERHGVYPNEEKEEYYERLLQDQEVAQRFGQSAIYSGEYAGQRSRPQSRNQIERPNSRLAFPEQANYANYQDYNDINSYGNHHQGSIQNRMTPDYFSQRPPSRGPNSAAELWRHAEDSELQKNVLPKRTDMPHTVGYYGNPNMAYRDPVHSAMAGKRTVQTLTQPNSAKV
ncbi:hypothetical protein ACJMK2_023076 [Sinanodonta woodiana]|uniref:PDZ domain-containing protein n=1 Tax=Sinanodonta woodiana TaxID=1069815 RepID=A0ABD3T4N1_SINWO